MNSSPTFSIRLADMSDATTLYAIEQASFEVDRLSKRRIKHWIQAENGIFLVLEKDQQVAGYGLALIHKGTRLARLYSIAILKSARGKGFAQKLLESLEKKAASRGRLYMRLEVAVDNMEAIRLYEAAGYSGFGIYNDYYEDHRDALRMQKRIRYVPANMITRQVPWYRQTTEFTCGPAALIMAMGSFGDFHFEQKEELAIWREATTIYMTSGHGGCHPVGLALAALKRGYKAEVYINHQQPLFIDSVRGAKKKQIITAVHESYVEEANAENIPIHYEDISQPVIDQLLSEGALLLMLISTYRMDNKKAPHWVVICAKDDECFYIHDPDPTENEQSAFDCQYLPIARNDFEKMSVFGSSRLRTAVVVNLKNQ